MPQPDKRNTHADARAGRRRGTRGVALADGFTGVVNLATTEEISALALARRIIDLAGRGKIRHIAQRAPQTLRELADGALARRALGWKPRLSLRGPLGYRDVVALGSGADQRHTGEVLSL